MSFIIIQLFTCIVWKSVKDSKFEIRKHEISSLYFYKCFNSKFGQQMKHLSHWRRAKELDHCFVTEIFAKLQKILFYLQHIFRISLKLKTRFFSKLSKCHRIIGNALVLTIWNYFSSLVYVLSALWPQIARRSFAFVCKRTSSNSQVWQNVTFTFTGIRYYW